MTIPEDHPAYYSYDHPHLRRPCCCARTCGPCCGCQRFAAPAVPYGGLFSQRCSRGRSSQVSGRMVTGSGAPGHRGCSARTRTPDRVGGCFERTPSNATAPQRDLFLGSINKRSPSAKLFHSRAVDFVRMFRFGVGRLFWCNRPPRSSRGGPGWCCDDASTPSNWVPLGQS